MASGFDRGPAIGDDNKSIHLTDHPDDPRHATVLVGGPVDYSADPEAFRRPARARYRSMSAISAMPDAFTAIVRRAAREHDLDPALLHAVIETESGYASDAVSPRGALGLMQLMPATARQYGAVDPFDPRQNVSAGARHLRALLDQFGQSETLALAAYNAGAAAVWRHHRQIPPFAETVAYVPKVLARYAARQREFRDASASLER